VGGLGLAVLAGCASGTPVQPASAGAAAQGDGSCHADRVAWAVGQVARQDVMKRVWQESGAGLIRPIAPKQAVTRDMRPDRINVHVDDSNVITRVECG